MFKMELETIPIKTTKKNFFLEYLTLKRPVINAILTKINHKPVTLNDIPMRVFSELLYYNDKYSDMKDDERFRNVFSMKTKKEICERLEMENHHLDIYFSQLRNIGILKNKSISKPFIVYARDMSLNFKFIINGQSVGTQDNK